MDRDHVPTSLPLLEAGYDLLLEKPFATSVQELEQLASAARSHRRTVMICHVLRYTPFYSAIRRKIIEGAVGDVINIQTLEHVSYHHMAVAFLRGKWARPSETGSSFLMAKCCHDLDLIAWMKSGVAPCSVASFGSDARFREEHAPAGAGTRCMVDCPIEPDCIYSARKHYIENPLRWGFYVWDRMVWQEHPSLDEKIARLTGDSPYGRCVWRCGAEVADRQSVMVQFADGATATHSLVGGTAEASRAIHIVGTHGEIQGVFEQSRFVVRRTNPGPGRDYDEQVVDLNVAGDMHGSAGGHGGGDTRLVEDCVRVLRGEPPSISTTTLADSISGHMIGFCADQAMAEHRVIDLA
jgi:predicted dehydrogenase